MPAGRGRPPSTSRARVSAVALDLFAREGFDETTMDDVARALGIGRRTLFRYFDSKNDLVWGGFGQVLDRLRGDLARQPRSVPLMEALRRAAASSNTYPEDVQGELRTRMTLITTVPTLQAHSMLRYAEWRAVVAEFAGLRLRTPPDAVAPQAIAHARRSRRQRPRSPSGSTSRRATYWPCSTRRTGCWPAASTRRGSGPRPRIAESRC